MHRTAHTAGAATTHGARPAPALVTSTTRPWDDIAPPSRRSYTPAPRAQHRAPNDRDGCGIVTSITMLVFAGCTLVSARGASVVAVIWLLIVAAWLRRNATGRTNL